MSILYVSYENFSHLLLQAKLMLCFEVYKFLCPKVFWGVAFNFIWLNENGQDGDGFSLCFEGEAFGLWDAVGFEPFAGTHTPQEDEAAEDEFGAHGEPHSL